MTANELRATVRRVADALGPPGIPFHFTGGVVASHYGEPRFTYDVDVVVDLADTARDLARIADALEGAFLIDRPGMAASVASNGMFQVLDQATYMKVDIHVGPRIPGELSRSRTEVILPGLSVPVVGLEDALVSKLLWARMGSHKALHDIAMISKRHPGLDWELVERLAREIGVLDMLRQCRESPPMP